MSASNQQPAFPNTGNPTWGMEPDYGMSLRDWFAGQALIGACMEVAREEHSLADLRMAMARSAYQVADAMLAERAKEPRS